MTTTEGTFITSSGTELFTRTWMAENPRYEVLLVHGIGEHSDRWEEPMSHLVVRGANVYTFDLRGHGRSAGRRIHLDRFDEYYEDISEIADATVSRSGMPWVLYGHSLGGLQCAGYLLSDRSPQPNVAVLSAPALDARVPTLLRWAAAVLGRITPKLALKNSIVGEQLSKDPAVGEAYFADPLVEGKGTASFGRCFLEEQSRLQDQHHLITTPTFVIHGADDPLVPPSASAGLAKSPSVERKLYPSLRHEIHNEPEAADVMGDVADWIDAKLF